VVIVLGVAAAAAARGPGAARVWNLILWIAAVVSAVLLLAAQAFIGAPSAALHPIVDTTTEPVLPLAAFTLVVLIIGIGTPGIRAAAHRDRDGVVLAGVIAAVVTGVVLVALLMATGGWLTTADFSLFVILNFVPWWVGTIVAALMALAALVGVSRALRDAWTLDPGMRALVATPAPGGHAWLRRTYPLFTLVVIAIIAIAPVPQVLVAVLAAVFAVIAIVANRTLGTDAATEPGASSESSESLVEADSPAAT
jgi:hypothetical protein